MKNYDSFVRSFNQSIFKDLQGLIQSRFKEWVFKNNIDYYFPQYSYGIHFDQEGFVEEININIKIDQEYYDVIISKDKIEMELIPEDVYK